MMTTALRYSLIVLIIATAVVSFAVSRTRQKPLTPLEQAIAKQRRLPPDSVIALQDLRLLGAVEMSFFSAKGRYATPEELKKAGYLDQLWPRSNSQNYRLSFHSQQHGAFVTHAEPAGSNHDFFRIDQTQAIRYERNHRPDVRSPVF
ncbi:MAG: hypothetical protein HY235_30295 [Acidobacteria bacterium]|nr:hypothetical protein [Acidobacteriota bacterium]